jgi:hypothetical protein
MKKNPRSQSGLFGLPVLFAFALCSIGILLSILSLAANPAQAKQHRNEAPAGPSAPLATGAGWSPVTAPNMTATGFQAITCLSSSDCWAVGNFYDGTTTVGRPMTEHWNGAAWSVVAAPAPTTTFSNQGTLEGVACASATQCWAVGEYQTNAGLQQPLIERWDGSTWTIVPANTSTTLRNYLIAVACNSASDCWAVGSIFDGTKYQTLIDHWNGTSWAVVSSPNPSSTDNSLADITCLAANNCWAVGNFTNSVPATQTLVEHWDGTSWVIITSANVSPTQFSALGAISCVTASDCWAVGESQPGSIYQTLAEHWDGLAWSIVSSPNSSPSEHNVLNHVRCNSTSDCLVTGLRIDTSSGLGQTLSQHWNGSTWSIVSTPNASPDDYVYGMACASASDCWGVGSFNGASVNQTFLMRWNGSTWSIVGSTSIAVTGTGYDNSFNGINCVAASDCWAVGDSAFQTLVAHWNGVSWAIISSPNTSVLQSNQLNAITCISKSDCWAVGQYQNGSNVPQTLIEHWNGTVWLIVSSPNAGASQSNTLNSVAWISSNDCTAVGSFVNNNGVHQTLALRWNGVAWNIVSSPNSSATQDNQLIGVTCVASECWAVGNYTPATVNQVLIEKWDGNAWSIFPSTNTSSSQDNVLNSVACFAASQCIGVGSFINGTVGRTLVEQWNSISSAIVSSPNTDATHNNSLYGINCTSSAQCSAVGVFVNASNIQQPLIEQWDGANWTIVPSNNNASVESFFGGVSCVAANNCWGAGTRKPGAVFQTMLTEYAPTTPPLGSLSSRLTHGSFGNFDVDLPQVGVRGVECRSGGAGDNYKLVFSFSNNLASVGSLTSGGTGTVTGSAMGPFPNQFTVSITGLTTTHNFTATLMNVLDAEGNSGDVAVTMGVLIGDVNANGVMTNADVSLVKARVAAGGSVDSSNFRDDVNANGVITNADVSITKAQVAAGAQLPP